MSVPGSGDPAQAQAALHHHQTRIGAGVGLRRSGVETDRDSHGAYWQAPSHGGRDGSSATRTR
eukprot:1042102-Rhodomonas_salina.1